MCTVLLPPGGYPIAVKYIISYHFSLTSLAMGRSKYESRVEVDFDCVWNMFSMFKKNVNNSVVTFRSSSKSASGGPSCTRNVVCDLDT